jgi:hypothetical protein
MLLRKEFKEERQSLNIEFRSAVAVSQKKKSIIRMIEANNPKNSKSIIACIKADTNTDFETELI